MKLTRADLRLLSPLFAPLAVLVLAALAVPAGPALPPSLAGLKTLGPYLFLVIGTAMSVWFNRSRAFIALASLLLAYAGYDMAQGLGAGSFAARAAFTGLSILVPANVLAALAFPERGVRQHRNYRWLLVGAAEIMLVAWIAGAGHTAVSGTAWQRLLESWPLRSPPTPFAGRIVLAAAFAAAISRTWPHPPDTEIRPLDSGMAGMLVAFFIACEWARSPGVFGAFMAAAGAILLVALLQESHRLAFRDELTALPSRRALDERLHGLGPAFVIAMVDVDHFKQFNDTYGHDIGDQVLKLVAARLAQVEGGGTAFRYGGEEFAVLFPAGRLAGARPHLEAIRASIEGYRMAVRGKDRPKDAQTGTALRHTRAATKTVSVTVSIGVAERSERHPTPADVIKAADEALYRAKRKGRNQVSR